MKTYKEMDWEQLEEHAEKIRHEIEIFQADAELWESRDVEGMPTPNFYSRIEELYEELEVIYRCQVNLEDENEESD